MSDLVKNKDLKELICKEINIFFKIMCIIDEEFCLSDKYGDPPTKIK